MAIKTDSLKFLFLLFICFFCQSLIGQNDTVVNHKLTKKVREIKSTDSEYTDTIVMKNGDKLIGDMKEMKNGVLTIETDYSDSDFKLKWVDISSINSNQYYLITLNDGVRINGKLHSKGKKGTVEFTDKDQTITVRIEDIVFLKAVETSFFSRFSASVSVGYNYTKSNSLSQFTVRSTLSYIADKWGFKGNYNSVRSSQEKVEETERTDATLGARYFLERDWFVMLSGNFLSNEEQKLKLRTTLKGGAGKYLIHSNRVYFSAEAGLAWNNEKFSNEAGLSRNSLEAYLGLEINMFDFDNISLLSNITAYPSLTEDKRIRTDFGLDIKYDLPLDFFIKVGLTHNFDSKPVENAASIDYIFQTTFGWEL